MADEKSKYQRRISDPDAVARRYLAGESSTQLGTAFGVTPTAICALLRRQRVPRRPISEAKRVHFCNHRFFSRINTEAKAYWLGFIAADGYIAQGRRLEVELAAKDEDHLVRLAWDLGATHPLYHYERRGHPNARLAIASPQMVADLARHGITGKKSASHRWPNFLSDKLLRHFLRGYVDGDGWVHLDRQGSLHFGFVSNPAFALAAQAWLASHLGLRITKLKAAGPVSIVQYGGNRQVPRIVNLLYNGATVFLGRKAEVAASLSREVA